MQAFLLVGNNLIYLTFHCLLDNNPNIHHYGEIQFSYLFLVYDGHGGSKVATHVSRNLHRQIVRRPEYKDGQYEEAITQVSPQFKIILT